MTNVQPTSGVGSRTVGVVADPEAAPAEIGHHLEAALPGLLARRLPDDGSWRVVFRRERLPAGDPASHRALLAHAADLRQRERWEVVLCVTDLPFRSEDGRALVAELATNQAVAVLSLPAFGATRLRRRVTDVVVELVTELTAAARTSERAQGEQPDHIDDRSLPGPFRLVTPRGESLDQQVVASRGPWRQFVGMVRSNRPWRLVLGLRGAVVGALAFSAFWLINPTIWQLGNSHNFPRLLLISLCAVVAIAGWLIVYHGLWERGGTDAAERHLVLLFNASTVVTLLIGVGIAVLGLLALNLVAAYLVISERTLLTQLHGSAGFVQYLKLTWMATSGASVAGALGAGFDSEESVREAAYSKREAERRRQWRARSDADEQAGRTAA